VVSLNFCLERNEPRPCQTAGKTYTSSPKSQSVMGFSKKVVGGHKIGHSGEFAINGGESVVLETSTTDES